LEAGISLFQLFTLKKTLNSPEEGQNKIKTKFSSEDG
jgi:hypothetical protein